MRSRCIPFLALILFPVFSPLAAAPVIWAVNDGEKVERDDLANPNKARNSVWTGDTIKIFGAQNEVVAFQVIVQADAAGLDSLRVSLPDLTLRGGTEKITYKAPALDPSDYVGRPIQIFTENYLNVTIASDAGWVYTTGSAAAPPDPTGWKPVQLVPENATPGRGGFPMAVGPSLNQGIWIEIYTGKGRTAGKYDGTVTVTWNGQSRALPLELELFNFALPDTNSMHMMAYFPTEQTNWYMGANYQFPFHRLAHRCRMELVNYYEPKGAPYFQWRFDGSDFSAPSKYEGPGQGVGNKIFPISFYGAPLGWDSLANRAEVWSWCDSHITFMNTYIPGGIPFVYVADETPVNTAITTIANNVHSNPGLGKGVKVFLTHSIQTSVNGAIDVWCCPTQGYNITNALAERAAGRDAWTYNGHRPQAGAITYESPAVDPRATIWGCFKHGIRVYYFWHAVHWHHNSQCSPTRERFQNVWLDPVTFDDRGGTGDPGFINGDGVLMYPGLDRRYPDQDRGLPGPISGLNLANFRRGLQDHQYLTMARQKGLTTQVNAALARIVPRMFSDASSAVSYPQNGNPYDSVIYSLGKAISTFTALETPAPETGGLTLEVRPNPFKMQTTFTISVGRNASGVKLEIYDTKGRLIQVFPFSRFTPNALRFSCEWNAHAFPSGVYLVRLRIGSSVAQRKILLMK